MVVITEISQESSSSSSTFDYDVFLSFRGSNTRYNFTDHLHKALKDANIETFLDDDEIQTGDELKSELETAIKASRASIIILSKDYASSTWCLQELVLILEQHKTSKHIVFPIFYNIEPTDVRKQQKSFGDAMEKHEEKMEREANAEKRSQMAEKMEEWKKALTEVADKKGKAVNGGRRETQIIEEIVKEISRRLDLHKQGTIPKVIGMKYSIRNVTSFLEDGSLQILTIWGMAGIGKTFLADHIFQLHYRDFEGSCFLIDIERRCKAPNGLLDLQKHFLKDLQYPSWMDIQNINVGTLKIVKSLQRKRMLLVLDDVSKFEQLDVFIGKEGLHQESKVIITTKNELLTEDWLLQTQAPLKHTKQALEGLDEMKSLELLSWHAFRRYDPKECQKEEPRKVVQYCQGHPLTLKVLGSSVRNRDTTWENLLKSLKKGIRPDIKEVLQISIDSLPCEEDKDVFKHIACFFICKDRHFTEEILKACGICNSSTIKNLSNRCLLTIETNYIYMHQLLQDIGRDMVQQESRKSWKHSLLWNHEDCLDVLRKGKGTSKTRGLILDMGRFVDGTSCGSGTAYNGNSEEDVSNLLRSPTIFFQMVRLLLSVVWWLLGWVNGLRSFFPLQNSGFQTHEFGKMCNLTILQLKYVRLDGSYNNFPEGLRWLCMHGFHLNYIPSDLPIQNMVALDMSNSNLKQLWKKPKLLKSLKFLNLSCCHELVRVGHFSGFPSLERLILAGCTSLVEVCESIVNHCDRLEVLDLSECSKLKKLPRSIVRLKKLRKLSINGCSDLGKLPCEMKDMKSLEVLEANSINKESQVSISVIDFMESIPRNSKGFVISLPSLLVRLSLKNNNMSNESFPMNFSGLSMLKRLQLDGNPIDSLPDFVRSLSRLESLTLNYCPRLTSILGVPSTVEVLITCYCHSLDRITFSPETSGPPTVLYYGCQSLTEIEGKFKVEALGEVEEEILRLLGWSINIKEDVKDFKHTLTYSHDLYVGYKGKIDGVQMIYEKGVFSTYFDGKEVPEWLSHRRKGEFISTAIPSCPNTCRIRGFNLCFSERATPPCQGYYNPYANYAPVEIRNLTKKCFWKYYPSIKVIRKGNVESNIVWLSHFIFEKNEFEEGDEVSFECGWYGNEIGMSIVYDDGNKKHNPFSSYYSWKRIKCKAMCIC